MAARNRINSKFLYELAEHFDEHGRDAIYRLFKDKRERYLTIIASLLPQKIDLGTPLDDMGDGELNQSIEWLRRQRSEVRKINSSSRQYTGATVSKCWGIIRPFRTDRTALKRALRRCSSACRPAA